MVRTLTLLATATLLTTLQAASGGPDQYGYTWKDSNEPGGPVYNWIDITTTGTQIMGLADDNIVGPVILGENFPFYWYGVKKVFIGANGYITFATSGNIAAPFPNMPAPGETDNYVAGFMTDLNFAGSGNLGQCWVDDNLQRTIISYLNVPYWDAIDINHYLGSNTFQFILSKEDSTITIQYQHCPGFSSSNGPICGIEAINGDIGLQQNNGVYPADGFAVRFYAPVVPLLQITDAAVNWVTDESNGGHSIAKDGTPFPLHAFIENTGNQAVSDFTATSQIFDANNQLVAVDATNIGALLPSQSADVIFPNSFVAAAAGTYRSVTSISGIPNEVVTSNNTVTQEVVAYDTTLLNNVVDWAGQLDDGIGISWTGGDGGVGAYILPPFYPIFVSASTCRIVSNFGNAGFTMKVYDDDGANGGPGTLLDSVMVLPQDAQTGDHEYPLATPFTLTSGGLYVQWYMQGQNVNIAQDIQPPFSLRSYEVIQGAWADYRDRETADFHLGLRMGQVPNYDVGVASLNQPVDGQVIGSSTAVRVWVRNYGNIAVTNIPLHYSFNGGSAVTQSYNGPVVQPGDSVLFMFAQPLLALQNATGTLCAWSSYAGDGSALNDTSCVSITISVGIDEAHASELHMYPVPARDRLALDGLPAGELEVQVYDAAGARVLTRPVRSTGGHTTIDLGGLSDGPYQVRAVAGPRLFQGRFVIAR